MPLVSKIISSAILSQFAIRKMTGRNTIDISGAIGSAVSQYLVIPNMVSCVLNGVAGPIGNVNSVAIIGITPKVMSSMMYSKALTKDMKGRDLRSFFDAISSGLSQVFMTMYLTGTATGIAVGNGIGRFNLLSENSLSKLLYTYMLSKKMTGRDTIKLCDSISFGIVNHLKTSVTFTLSVVGAIAPVPPVGPVPIVGIPAVFTKII
jgi:hypothetical protein